MQKRWSWAVVVLAASALGCASGRSQGRYLPRSPRSAGWDRRQPDEGSRLLPLMEKAWAGQPRFERYLPFEFSAEVVGRHREKRALYLRVKLAHRYGALGSLRAALRSPVHGVVVLGAASRHGPELLLRFVREPAAAGASLILVANGLREGAVTAANAFSARPLRGQVVLRGIEQAPADAMLPVAFFSAAARHWRDAGPHASRLAGLGAFVAARLSRWATELGRRDPLKASRFALPMRGRRRRGELGEMMALYSGLTSIDEALQSDRGLLLSRGSKDHERAIPLAALEGVKLPAHPWEQLIGGSGRPSVPDPLARFVPAQMAYLYAHDLRTMLRVKRELAGRFAGLMQLIEGRGGDHSFLQRYERQLAIRSSALAEKLGHLAAKGVALIASDPLQREGSDLTVLFGLGSEALLRAQLERYATEARRRRPDARLSSLQIEGHEAELLATPDRDIHRFLIRLGEVLVISNSRRVIELLIGVQCKKIRSLAESGDYRYLRARYPFSEEQEDGFAFLGDAFVAHVTGPRFKILQARRMAVKADLRALSYAALLYGWLGGKAPKSLAELASAGYLEPFELRHADGAPIAYDPERGPSSRWGRAQRLRPSIELPLEAVSLAEKEAYERFARSYQRHWRGYIDPIAVRIRAPRGGQLELDGRMLPLIERSDYDKLLALVGQTVTPSPDLKSGLLFSFAVGKNAKLRRMMDGLAMSSLGSKKVRLGWLGDWVAFGGSDRGGFFDVALVLSGARLPGVSRGRGMLGNLPMVLRDAPLFVEAQVASPFALAATLAALRSKLSETAPGMLQWKTGQTYRGQAVTKVATGPEKGVVVTLHYGVVKDVLVIALSRAMLEERFDAHLDGQGHRALAVPMQSTLRIRPWLRASWLPRLADWLLSQHRMRAQEAALAGVELLANAAQRWEKGSLKGRARAFAHLGWVPQSVHGGVLAVDRDGIASDSAVGNAYLQPAALKGQGFTAASELQKLLGALEDLELGLAFEGKGAERALHVRSRWFYQVKP